MFDALERKTNHKNFEPLSNCKYLAYKTYNSNNSRTQKSILSNLNSSVTVIYDILILFVYRKSVRKPTEIHNHWRRFAATAASQKSCLIYLSDADV